MKVYPPHYMTPKESQQQVEDSQHAAASSVTNDTLIAYVPDYIDSYRKTVEEFFPTLAPLLPFYAAYPFKTTIVRFGLHPVIMALRHNKTAEVDVMDVKDFQPPMDSVNVFDIAARLNAQFLLFDFSPRRFDKQEAAIIGTRNALNALLEHFWTALVPTEKAFKELCQQLLIAEGVDLEMTVGNKREDDGMDAIGSVLLNEPGGFRRIERWGFEFKFYHQGRLSAKELRNAEAVVSKQQEPMDVLCLLTSEDLTSIGRTIVVENPRLRVWDRAVMSVLVHKHPNVFRQYFKDYPIAVEELSRRFQATASPAQGSPNKVEEFRGRMQSCPTGQAHFAVYETIGIDAFSHLFSQSLGDAKPQDRTADGKQRRDVLFRNKRNGSFWQRIFHRFDADFVVVDFKNYGDPVGADVIFDVEKYSNKALGRFVMIVSRHGKDNTVEAAQLRVLRDREIVVLVISDGQLLEMVGRKEQGQSPEDVLEDSLDEILRKF